MEDRNLGAWASYGATSNGERFLLNERLESAADRSLTVILNWIESLRRR